MSNARGSLLFETLIALLVLTVGITASMRLFGQALYAGNKSVRQMQARHFLDDRTFLMFAEVDEDAQKQKISAGPEGLEYRAQMEPLNPPKAKDETALPGSGGHYQLLKLSVLGKEKNLIIETETVVKEAAKPVLL